MSEELNKSAAENKNISSFEVTLAVGSEKFTCARSLLVENSAYFRAMLSPDHNGFSESKQQVITLKGVDPQALRLIIRCLLAQQSGGLTGRLLHKQFSLPVLVTTAMLQFESLFEKCVEVANSNLNVENCLKYLECAEQLGARELHNKAHFLALLQFTMVSKTSAFLELIPDDLENYLSDETLRPTSETKVVESVLTWVEDEIETRREHLERLLYCARWRCISEADLRTLTLNPTITELPKVLSIIKCILSLITLPIESIAPSVKLNDTNTEEADGKSSNDSISADTQDLGCCPKPEAMDSLDVSSCVQAEATEAAIDSDMNVLEQAWQLLSLPTRKPIQVPCFIGHRLRLPPNRESRRKYIDNKDTVPCLGFLNPAKLQLEAVVDITKVQKGNQEYQGYSVIPIGKGVYILGGECQLGHGNWNMNIWCYDILNNEWTEVGSMQDPRRHFSSCFIGDEIYVIGGIGKFRLTSTSCDAFSTTDGSWRKCSPAPETIMAAACCVHEGLIYVLASKIYCYTPSLNQWHALKKVTLPSHMGFQCAMPYGKHIYLTGKYTRDLMRFSPEEAERGLGLECLGYFNNDALKTCLVGDCIYMFSDKGRGVLVVEEYDIVKNEFRVLWSRNEDSPSLANQANFTDFIPEQSSSGCFPVVKCWLD